MIFSVSKSLSLIVSQPTRSKDYKILKAFKTVSMYYTKRCTLFTGPLLNLYKFNNHRGPVKICRQAIVTRLTKPFI